MRRILTAIVVTVLAFGLFGGSAVAADREQMTITELTVIGDAILPAGSIGSAELASAVQTAVASSLSVTCTTNANGGTNVLVVTAKDLNGTTLATNVFFRCWIGDTAGSVPAAVVGAFTVSNGTEIQEIIDKGDYYVMTAAAGTVTITISDTPGVTNYFHAVASGGRVGLTTMAWNIVP
ncbi:MAG TPA: hypothetical protein VMW24_27530 [Sedimentisphaerales bacterium]|nr:hypothetical protein [Sedimentisphaerales bacterium]